MAPQNDANMAFILCCMMTLFVVIGASTTNTDLYTALLAVAVLFTPCFAVVLLIAVSQITHPIRPSFNGRPLSAIQEI